MNLLFDSAERFVVICSNDTEGTQVAPHERHRSFTRWVETHRPQWRLERRVDPPPEVEMMASMFLYARSL